ncbi:MAG: inorganic diphosphatase [Myxococcota bacterium]
MHPWHDIPAIEQDGIFNTVIEIPRGSKVKYELDKPSGLLRVDRILYSSVIYPADYGFIPQTYADDNDPLDAMVLTSEAMAPLAILRCRAIGVMRMLDEGKGDDKIIAVHVDDPAFAHYEHVDQLPPHLTLQMQRFFEDYKTLENKSVKVESFQGPDKADKILEEAIDMYRRSSNQLRLARGL